MPEVVIVVEPTAIQSLSGPSLVTALKAAITYADRGRVIQVRTIDTVLATPFPEATIFCPLTLDLPESLDFPGQYIYALCRNLTPLRQLVAGWGYPTGSGNFWLPVVLTARGPLFAEVIGLRSQVETGAGYLQPIDLPDSQRQPLYHLGFRLLHHLQAPPSVYLLQVGWQTEMLCFDRLIPFPDQPALASLKVQTPDLLTCHWHCLAGLPIQDLIIRQSSPTGP